MKNLYTQYIIFSGIVPIGPIVILVDDDRLKIVNVDANKKGFGKVFLEMEYVVVPPIRKIRSSRKASSPEQKIYAEAITVKNVEQIRQMPIHFHANERKFGKCNNRKC